MPSIGIADKTTLDAVNTKVGTNADAAGTSTLFARLAQIAAYVDTLESLVGTASPTGGDLTTLFKGLKLIADYVDTLETKVGLNTDGAGTSTLFARLAQIAGYTDTLETLIGTASPSSGGTDTLFKYEKRIADLICGGTPNKSMLKTNCPQDTTTTLVSVSGSGVIDGIVVTGGVDLTTKISVEIDGIEVLNTSSDYYKKALSGFISNDSTPDSGGYCPIPLRMRYTSSFAVKIVQAGGAASSVYSAVFWRSGV